MFLYMSSEYIKTTRDKIEINQMDLIKTKNKEKYKSYYILYTGLKIGVM